MTDPTHDKFARKLRTRFNRAWSTISQCDPIIHHHRSEGEAVGHQDGMQDAFEDEKQRLSQLLRDRNYSDAIKLVEERQLGAVRCEARVLETEIPY